jgi:hypothetical protein
MLTYDTHLYRGRSFLLSGLRVKIWYPAVFFSGEWKKEDDRIGQDFSQ